MIKLERNGKDVGDSVSRRDANRQGEETGGKDEPEWREIAGSQEICALIMGSLLEENEINTPLFHVTPFISFISNLDTTHIPCNKKG